MGGRMELLYVQRTWVGGERWDPSKHVLGRDGNDGAHDIVVMVEFTMKYKF